MTGQQLFRTRLFREWRFQYGVFKSVFDWTIVLYILIPALAIFIGMYRSWWVDVPSWIEPFPLSFLFFLGYFMTWGGQYRTFVSEADKVFLIRNKSLFMKLKQLSFVYSLTWQSTQMVLVVLLLLPFLTNHFQLTGLSIASFAFFLIGMKWSILTVKRTIRKIQHKYLRVICAILLFVAGGYVTDVMGAHLSATPWLVWAMSLLLAGFGVYFYQQQVRKLASFEHELLIDREERLKYVGIIFQFSYSVEKTTPVIRKKPWLFRGSKRIWKKRSPTTAFLELFFKVFLRSSSYLFTYFQVMGVTITALIVLPPLWLKVTVFLSFLVMMLSYLSACWAKITAKHPFVQKYQEKQEFFTARRYVVYGLFTLAVAIVVVFSQTGLYYLNQ